MAYYYYDIFNTTSITTYTQGPFESTTTTSISIGSYVYSGYTFNSTNGTYATSGNSNYLYNYGAGYKAGSNKNEILRGVAVGTYPSGSARVTISKRIVNTTSGTKGAIYQTNKVLDDTYPIDGVLGSYWYVRKSIIQTPTAPQFINASVKLKKGESFLIKWDNSVDPQGLMVSYTLQYSLDNKATWINIITNESVTEKQFVVPQTDISNIELQVFSSNSYETSSNSNMTIHVITNKYLIQDDEQIKAYSGSAWSTIGLAPFTKSMFDTNGMDDVTIIPIDEWKSTMKILRWSNEDEAMTVNITTPKSLYDTVTKAYKGIGAVETEVEALDESRSALIVTAEHTGAIFHYSLNDGANWKELSLEKTIDIKNEKGNLLKIKVELPTTTATLSALSYAWA